MASQGGDERRRSRSPRQTQTGAQTGSQTAEHTPETRDVVLKGKFYTLQGYERNFGHLPEPAQISAMNVNGNIIPGILLLIKGEGARRGGMHIRGVPNVIPKVCLQSCLALRIPYQKSEPCR